MREAHRAAVDAYARLVEQVRRRGALGKNARAQQSQALATLRDQVSDLDDATSEVQRLAAENRNLAIELERRETYFNNQMSAIRIQLEQAVAKTNALQREVSFDRRQVEATRAAADELRELLSPSAAPERLGRSQGISGLSTAAAAHYALAYQHAGTKSFESSS